MKRIIILALIVLMAIPAAAEDLDLAKLSYADLAALGKKCQDEMITRPEWKQAKVPQGIYLIGEDIPAGKYTISAMASSSETRIDILRSDAEDWEIGDSFYLGTSFNEMTVNLTLYNGDQITIAFGSVTFSPFVSLF